ncbi:MAG TPA: SulP family inorganic anion transporter [Paenalcaligenes sp.]|nr:SulP family inorganic anion transporter [Paenalcaligenes sp.]
MIRPRNRLKRMLPFLHWPEKWRSTGIHGDIIAGITVGLILVPQALAYAQLAGLPAHIGLYAALLPAIVAALLGSCSVIATGPVALTSLLTGSSVIAISAKGNVDIVQAAILLCLLSGIIQLILGVLKIGWLLKLLSRPVMTGFISASALLIVLSQLPAILGIRLNRSDHFLLDLFSMLRQLGDAQLISLLFGLITFAALLVLQRVTPKLPNILIVICIASLIAMLTQYESHGGSVIGYIPSGLPSLGFPTFDFSLMMSLLSAALVIALVSFMEVTASAKVITTQTGENWNQNQELISQGLAKIASAFSGGMPVSGSFSRSALNFSSGARTGFSALIATCFVVITLLYLTPFLWHLPNAVLAAVIIRVVYKLLEPKSFLQIWRTQRLDGLIAAITFITTLAFAPNIHHGMLIGLLLSLLFRLYQDMYPHVVFLKSDTDDDSEELKRVSPRDQQDAEVMVVRFAGPLTFITAENFKDTANLAIQRSHAHVLLISAAGINALDSTGINAIDNVYEAAQRKNCLLAFCGLQGQIRRILKRSDLWDRLYPHLEYETEHQAIQALRQLREPPRV